MKRVLPLFLGFILLYPLSIASASWAYPFVVYSGHIYRVTEQAVQPEDVGQKIGKVTKYSDREGTYRGNFSNIYPKGTGYYALQGRSRHEAIAVRTGDDTYILAIQQGAYAGGLEMRTIWWLYVGIGIVSVACFAAAAWAMQKRRAREGTE
ncbi:hypothetical protein FHS19_004103 [Paenibacillus rhizosphaerae]|uniref:Uncharacterized protein n=1 Tax=Paenibacillus rhizosphaerae TaxID=297318 RepID=A0A839TVI8_9BACL|nr:hypothetical protein [Paenibacillus rhizosphaerae]MBB3129428.1 hypothetical protein [Paenibacillus rhizosphaerae]